MSQEAIFLVYVQALLPTGTTEVIWDRPNAPRPQRPYGLLRLDNSRTFENADRLPVDASGNQQIITIYEVDVTVEYYAVSGAFDALSQLRALTYRTTVQGLCSPWTMFKRGNVINVSALLDSTFNEDRASLQLSFRSALLDVDDVGYIGNVNVSGGLTDNVTNVSVTASVITGNTNG